VAGIELPDWMRATALIGFDDPDYRAITVDEHGQLNVLLRGAYNDEIRTVTLDDEGRISAFVIDSVDAWGRMLSIGNAEMAARLGSIVTFDRRGHVIFLQDFEQGLLHLGVATSGDGAAVELDPTVAKSGSYAAKLVAGKDDNHFAQLQRYEPIPLDARIGIEFSFSRCKADTYLELNSHFITPTGTTDAIIRYYPGTTTMQYYGSDFRWHNIDEALDLYDHDHYFHTVKLVADYDTSYYSWLRVDNMFYPLSEHELAHTAIPTGLAHYVTLTFFDTADANPYIYVDDIIITNAEP